MSSLEDYLAVALLTPLFDPTRHTSPTDPTVIWGIPVNLVGLSGVGKSARIKAIGRSVGLNVHTVYAGTKQPEDFSGAFVPTPNGIVIECVLPAARRCIEAGGGLIFLDEISCTRPATQASLLSFVNDRQVGDHLIPPRTRILMAMNPPEYAAGGHSIEPPLANRMAWKTYDNPSRDAWCSWLQGNATRLTPLDHGEQLVAQNWSTYWPEIVGLLTGFMQSVPEEVLHNQPKPEDEKSSAAWPSHRMWHWAACAVTAVRCINSDPSLELELVSSLVGEAASVQWAEWIAKADLPKPIDMLTKGWDPDPLRLDKTIAALTSMTQFVKSRADREEAMRLAEPAWRLLLKTIKAGKPDLVVNCAQTLIRSKLGRRDTTPNLTQAAESVIHDLAVGEFSSLAD